MSTIAIIPARGGSKGIPRKNLRPVAGKPLIFYSIRACLESNLVDKVVVSTDDDEIALFAERFGAEVLMRDPRLSDDKTTLDPVIINAYSLYCEIIGKEFSHVVTVQPTSPLVRGGDIDNAITKLIKSKVDTIVSVVDDRHLCWTVKDGITTPLYTARVNRQQLPPNYKETGAIIGCTSEQLLKGSRIGEKVDIFEVAADKSFDIDSYSDLYLCEALLSRKKIVFSVVGYPEVGLGHAFRAVMLAHELVQFELIFICDSNSLLAASFIRSQNYTVIVAKEDKLAETLLLQKPNLIINDILDTSVEYMNELSKSGIPLVNFEDMGLGQKYANYVINALYPHQTEDSRILVGAKYFCLRDEFLYLNDKQRFKNRELISRVLVTFGGVDEGNITTRTLSEIASICMSNNITIEVIVGPGYTHLDELNRVISQYPELNCDIIIHTKRISEHMCKADLAITSGGRTVFELASLQVPMIVVCQNQRETTHTFASEENGIVNLGLHTNLLVGAIKSEFIKLLNSRDERLNMIDKMKKLDLSEGKNRVVSLIKSLVNY